MSLDALPLTEAQRDTLRSRGIVQAQQLQGMLAVASVRPALAGLLGMSVDGLAPLDAALAASGHAPDALEPFQMPPSGVPLPDGSADEPAGACEE